MVRERLEARRHLRLGAVVVGDDLIVYYGGGDKYVAAAKANLRDFLHKLTSKHAALKPVKK